MQDDLSLIIQALRNCALHNVADELTRLRARRDAEAATPAEDEDAFQDFLSQPDRLSLDDLEDWD